MTWTIDQKRKKIYQKRRKKTLKDFEGIIKKIDQINEVKDFLKTLDKATRKKVEKKSSALYPWIDLTRGK